MNDVLVVDQTASVAVSPAIQVMNFLYFQGTAKLRRFISNQELA